VIGTYNIDPRSANLNSELIVICRNSSELANAMTASLQSRLAQSRPITGTADAGGYSALIEGADRDTVFMMRMIRPFASLLDFLL
jgi:putative cardiolipin synthase